MVGGCHSFLSPVSLPARTTDGLVSKDELDTTCKVDVCIHRSNRCGTAMFALSEAVTDTCLTMIELASRTLCLGILLAPWYDFKLNHLFPSILEVVEHCWVIATLITAWQYISNFTRTHVWLLLASNNCVICAIDAVNLHA